MPTHHNFGNQRCKNPLKTFAEQKWSKRKFTENVELKPK